jgi:hypothetical protein
MANTTNFNWETPDDTDLVKDGALAIRTLGNSIDTSFVDLKGGTTGQILSKNSNTDLDYTWINNDTGDITGVTAGTGISGGGTSGTVTITNSMATEITAAGDIIVGTGSGTFDNLPIGTTGQVLTADTTVSPYKVKWATASSTPSFVGCLAVASANQSISNDTITAINFGGTDLWDTDGFHDPASNNSRITIPTGKGGYYRFDFNVRFANNATGTRAIFLGINGTAGANAFRGIVGSSTQTTLSSSFVYNLSAGDYVQIFAYQTSGGSLNIEYDGATTQRDAGLRFGCHYLGA